VKQFLAIFFLSALCLPTLYKAGLFTFYQLNRDYIADNYCVNKDRPITMCYGKCFLEKGLSIADHIPDTKNLVSQLKFESSEFETTGFVASFSVNEVVLVHALAPTPMLRDGVASTVFRPPLV
jgi:hypothetical protein